MGASPSLSAALRALPRGLVTRFAPAPTGYLHLGHAANAVWVWGVARLVGARVLLRVEDHDRGRCRPEYEAALLDDLDWLGLEPDGLATAAFRAGGVAQRQSDNTVRYAEVLAALEADRRAYACTCSRVERYPGTCRTRGIPPTETPARRVIIDPGSESFTDLRLGPLAQDPSQQCGDFLIRDRNGNWTYQFAVTIDDLDQGVDLVIRGEDLLDSTGRQRRLAAMLGRGAMPHLLHHPLLRTADGRKMSKSAGDTGIREHRAAGRSPAEVLGLAAHLTGLQPEPRPLTAHALAALFD